jgi:uncharacterized protein
MSRVALLDVNVLVALFDPDHVHHDLAHDWFAGQRQAGWATCATTENELVRVLSHPRYGAGLRAEDVVSGLRKFRSSAGHYFWPESVSIADSTVFDPAPLAGPKSVTDVYLLGLARRHKGTLATFDQSIPRRAVVGARRPT